MATLFSHLLGCQKMQFYAVFWEKKKRGYNRSFTLRLQGGLWQTRVPDARRAIPQICKKIKIVQQGRVFIQTTLWSFEAWCATVGVSWTLTGAASARCRWCAALGNPWLRWWKYWCMTPSRCGPWVPRGQPPFSRDLKTLGSHTGAGLQTPATSRQHSTTKVSPASYTVKTHYFDIFISSSVPLQGAWHTGCLPIA